VRKEIEKQTDVLAGGGKDIVTTPINLTIFAQNVVDLTLVDLPGVVQVSVHG
jgi:hypothetical protein